MQQVLYKAAVDDTIGGGGRVSRRAIDQIRNRAAEEHLIAQYNAMMNNQASEQSEQLRNAAARQATQEQMASALDYERIMDRARRRTYARPEPAPEPPPEPEKPSRVRDNEFTL